MNYKDLKIIKLAFLLVVFCNAAVDISHKILLQNIAFKVFDGSEQVVWISIINLLIIVPFLLLFSTSGFLSDKYDKKDILIYGAISSFCLSLFMIVSYLLGSFYLAMFGLFLLAIQSAIYSPAKFGIIIDIYGKSELARGNSFLQAISIIAILLSMASFSFLFESHYAANNLDVLTTKEQLLDAMLPLAFYIVPIALVEMLVSLAVLKHVQATYPRDEKLELDRKKLFKGELLLKNIKILTSHHVILLSVVGLSVFWGVSQGMVAVFPAYAKEYLNESNVFVINGVIAASAIGIALGSLLYSRFSKHYIEVGTIPLGALGMSAMIYLATLVESSFMLGVCFLFFGLFGGLFIVPLNALIQFNAKRKELGLMLAGNNWFHSLFMFFVLAGTTTVSLLNFDALSTIYIILGLTLVGTFYTVISLPQSLIIFFLKWFVGLKYRLEVNGVKNIPSQGGALLLGNHVSWLDWAIIYISTPRDIKFVMDKTIYRKWYLTWILKLFQVIPVSTSASKQTIKKVAEQLDAGHIVVLFPEGNITRNGHLGEFKKGFEKILSQTQNDVPVIAFYIRGLWESMFSRANKKFIRSYRSNSVTVSFSKPIRKSLATADRVKKEVITLTTQSWKDHIDRMPSITEAIFDRQKEVKNNLIFADSTGVELSGYKFLTASILFKDLLKPRLTGQNIGLLIPSSAGGAFLNTSVLMLGKTAVNMNFTASMESLLASMKKADVQTIIASKKFVEKLTERGIDIYSVLDHCEVIWVEELKLKIKKAKGLMTLLSVVLLPSAVLKAMHIKAVKKEDTALIMFSSGSEGTPKGIELSHQNVVGNSQQIASVLNVNDNDILVGSLPLFHAFGAVVTNFLPLIEGIACVAHPDPTDGLAIGKLINKYKATILLGTSTFFRLYAVNPKVLPEMFASLRLVVAGAEKLSLKVRQSFLNKFNKEIYEGYGTTETTPVASCNLPDIVTPEGGVQVGNKVGSIGMPLPGTKIKIVDPDSMKELQTNEEGMLLVSGVQVMKGYLKDEQKTKEAIITLSGKQYYITGDKARIDEDGFVTIVDRYSRFAKLGGEMVSMGAIEQKLATVIESDEIEYIATSIPDDKKGEKVVLLISGLTQEQLEPLKSKINEAFDNKLMLPSVYKLVSAVPKLGTGKSDFKQAKAMALES